jgi:hypothetical protein
MNDMRNRFNRSATPMGMARALGWFSIGLGLAEALLPAAVSRASGIKGDERLVRGYGAREIANGVGILTAKDPTPWIWARVAGDVMDISTLATRGSVKGSALALIAVAGVAALDVACASKLKSEKQRPRGPTRDYSDRSGLPESPDQMRGAARRELKRVRALSPVNSAAPS